MTTVQAIDAKANYNAVKIQINDPKTNIPEGLKNSEDNGIYNAVNIEVNRPSVDVAKKAIYDYPQAQSVVTYDMAGIAPVTKPQLPPPNLTTTEAEKAPQEANVSFQAAPEIVEAEKKTPNANIKDAVAKLSSNDYDVQAQQMEEIAKLAMQNPEKTIPFVTAEIFDSLINIIKKDTTNFAIPTESQIEARKKIIINEIAKEQAKLNNQKPEDFTPPYKVTEAELKEAMTLTEMEQAERNKEYALYTIAILAKTYADEVQKETGNIVPLTDLPGASEIVDTIKNNNNPGIKIASLDALRYISRPEYKDEIKSIFTVVTRDENPQVAELAKMAIQSLEQ